MYRLLYVCTRDRHNHNRRSAWSVDNTFTTPPSLIHINFSLPCSPATCIHDLTATHRSARSTVRFFSRWVLKRCRHSALWKGAFMSIVTRSAHLIPQKNKAKNHNKNKTKTTKKTKKSTAGKKRQDGGALHKHTRIHWVHW